MMPDLVQPVLPPMGVAERAEFLNSILDEFDRVFHHRQGLEQRRPGLERGARRNLRLRPCDMVGNAPLSSSIIPPTWPADKPGAFLRTRWPAEVVGGVETNSQGRSEFTGFVTVTLRRKRGPRAHRLHHDLARPERAKGSRRATAGSKTKELEEQNRRVQEASRLKSEFLANTVHEL